MNCSLPATRDNASLVASEVLFVIFTCNENNFVNLGTWDAEKVLEQRFLLLKTINLLNLLLWLEEILSICRLICLLYPKQENKKLPTQQTKISPFQIFFADISK